MRPTTLFILVFGLVILLSLLGNYYFLSESGAILSAQNQLLFAITFATQTQALVNPAIPLSWQYYLFSISIITINGLIFNSVLFWLCRQIFGSYSEKAYSFKNAFAITVRITLIAVSLLTLFFLYCIPAQNLENGNLIMAAVGLAIGSFHLAGIPFYNMFFAEGFIAGNFIIQIGITAGITVGSLGIYVISELFSISRLRRRLENPEIDWSYITKINVFGTILLISVCSALYWGLEKGGVLSGKNLTESAIASVFQISSFRGFGAGLPDRDSISTHLLSFTSLTTAGPFSAGGGFTLLIFVFIGALFLKNNQEQNIINTKNFMKHLLIFSLPAIMLTYIFSYSLNVSSEWIWPVFTGNYVWLLPETSWPVTMLKSLLLLHGKLVFIFVGFWYLRKLKIRAEV